MLEPEAIAEVSSCSLLCSSAQKLGAWHATPGVSVVSLSSRLLQILKLLHIMGF